MRNRIITLAGAAVVVAGLATAASAATAPAALASGCSTGGQAISLYDYGLNYQQGFQEAPAPDNLFFDTAVGGGGTAYCEYKRPNGTYQFWAEGTGECMALNSTSGYIDLDEGSECNSNSMDGHTWDDWDLTSEGSVSLGPAFEMANQYNADCLYDDTQPYAIYTGCKSTDHFEWFVGPVTNP
jgi:hypothetical protein